MPPGMIRELLKNPYALILILATLLTSITATFLAWRSPQTSLQQQVEPRIAELEKLRADLLAS